MPTAPTRFDRDTALRAVGDGVFEGRIDPGWWIVDGPNGGYVAAVLLRAATLVLDDPVREPVTLTAQYLRPPREGAVSVAANVERAGRSMATVGVRMHQEDRLLALATVAFSAPRDHTLGFCDLEPPDVLPPDGCPPFPPPGEEMIPLNGRYECRWAFGDPPFSGSPRSAGGGWIRTEDARQVDALLTAALSDAWIPPVFSRLAEPWTLAVPTIELSVYFRDALPRPAEEYVLGVFRTNVAARGFLEEDGELWSEDGVLLAQSRQLAAIVTVEG